MTVLTRVWDTVELINGVDVLNHPNPKRKEHINRVIANGGSFIITEIDGRITQFNTIHGTLDVETERQKLQAKTEQAEIDKLNPVEDETTKQINTLKDTVLAMSDQIKDLKDSIALMTVEPVEPVGEIIK